MNSPSIPNPADAAVAGATADVANFPFTQQINALAQTGGKATIGGQTYDFTGLGNAAQSNAVSDQMAQALLDIQNNYGSQYITQRLADLKQSDPTGYAARQQLFDKILADSKASPDRPLSNDLQTSINQTLQNAGQLDEKGLQEVQQGVRGQQVAKGIYLGSAPASEEASAVVGASDALRSQQQQGALSYLQSGVSPADVAYRQIQQSLSNLGAFVNNQTPESQFGSLSSAGNGAAPFNSVNYSNPAQINTGSAAYGQQFANTLYGQQSNYSNQQSNPWLAGLSTGIGALNTAYNLGANPFGGGSGGYGTGWSYGNIQPGTNPLSMTGVANYGSGVNQPVNPNVANLG